jgi:hypothetical protein
MRDCRIWTLLLLVLLSPALASGLAGCCNCCAIPALVVDQNKTLQEAKDILRSCEHPDPQKALTILQEHKLLFEGCAGKERDEWWYLVAVSYCALGQHDDMYAAFGQIDKENQQRYLLEAFCSRCGNTSPK